MRARAPRAHDGTTYSVIFIYWSTSLDIGHVLKLHVISSSRALCALHQVAQHLFCWQTFIRPPPHHNAFPLDFYCYLVLSHMLCDFGNHDALF